MRPNVWPYDQPEQKRPDAATLDKSNQPMLDRLCPDYQGVVSFEVSVDKQSIKIIEACDRYFAETFSKTEFQQLIEELKTLHGKMVD